MSYWSVKHVMKGFCAAIVLIFAGCGGGGGTTTAYVSSPAVQKVSPANGATGVALNSGVSIIFSEAMDPTSITNGNFTVSGPAGSLSATITASGNSAILRPGLPLLPNTTYTATIAKGAKNAAGVPLASDYTWTITTGTASDTTAPSMASTNPANGATGVLTNPVSAVFSEPMDPSSLNGNTFSLSQGGNAVPGTVTYDGATATFTPSGSLLANTTYTATITGAKDLAGNTLPSLSWTFTRGWFVLGTAPRVTSATPANNDSNTAVTTAVTATFNVAMDPATITTGTFQLSKGTTSISGAVSLNNAGTVATFTPTSQLAPNSTYTATITTGAKSASGASLATTTSWSFTTGITGDTTAPTVLTTVPAANAAGVAKTSAISITFSEGIDQASLTSSSIVITSAGGPVAGVLAMNSSNTDFKFTPSAALSPNTLYTVSIKGTLKDLAGNALGSDYSWTFTTGP